MRGLGQILPPCLSRSQLAHTLTLGFQTPELSENKVLLSLCSALDDFPNSQSLNEDLSYSGVTLL
jgi:hypothetical protein